MRENRDDCKQQNNETSHVGTRDQVMLISLMSEIGYFSPVLPTGLNPAAHQVPALQPETRLKWHKLHENLRPPPPLGTDAGYLCVGQGVVRYMQQVHE